jgi:uncharacterized protein YcbX
VPSWCVFGGFETSNVRIREDRRDGIRHSEGLPTGLARPADSKLEEGSMQEVTVRGLWTYPVKGCQGVPAEALEVSPMGVVGDREFVLWEDGKLVDQKETPRVASIAADLRRDEGILRFRHAERGVYYHAIREEGEAREAGWILDAFETIDQGDAVSDWLSAIVGRHVRLVSPAGPWKINFPIPQMTRVHDTPKQRFYAASPVSLANQTSLEDLNERLAEPVGMDRFRVNVVIDGMAAYEEDHVDSLSNDRVELACPRSSARRPGGGVRRRSRPSGSCFSTRARARARQQRGGSATS